MTSAEKKYEQYSAVPVMPRIAKLRNDIIEAKPILCSERALVVTESYKATESEHYVLRRAHAFAAILDKMTQNIWDGELIVGSHGSNGRRSAPVFPEFATEWLEEELDEILETREQDTFIVPEAVKKDLKGIFPYWRGKTVFNKYRSLLPDETKKVRDAYMFSRDLFERNGYGHTVYQAEKLLKLGLKGIKDEINAKLAAVDATSAQGLEAGIFYEGLLICIDGVIRYAERYAQKALAMAETEQDPARKAELKRIADVCAWVPANPARDMWDALQVVAFMQILIQTETNGDSVSPGRMDQYLYPFFKKDVAEGRYTLEQIQELLDCLWLKFNEIVKVQDRESTHIHPGFPMTPNLTVGGVTAAGAEATNELSFMMLNSQKHVQLTNPQFTVRIHKNTSEEFKLRVAEVIELGTGMPALFGDEGCMAAIRRTVPDIPEERIRDYGIVGCVELAARGFQGRVNGGMLNVARVVDLALNDGVDRLTGEQLGPRTGKPEAIHSFDELLAAVRKQMAYVVRQQVINALVVDMVQRENTPHLFMSGLIEGCIESGKDMTWGGSSWGATPILMAGLATAANSLAAVKQQVFELKAVGMAELKAILDGNFAGERGEAVRQKLYAAPKYGNDDDYADAVMRTMTDIFFEEIEKHKDIDGRPYSSMILTLGGTVPHGWKTGATADGRPAAAPVSDSMSPSNVGAHEGPTAVALSASKIDQTRILEGNVLNMKFSRNAIAGDAAKKKLMAMVSAYFNELGGQEIQFNIVDSDMLKAAQKDPEKYKDLIIRVAGYSARFIELARELQNDIIERAEHEAV